MATATGFMGASQRSAGLAGTCSLHSHRHSQLSVWASSAASPVQLQRQVLQQHCLDIARGKVGSLCPCIARGRSNGARGSRRLRPLAVSAETAESSEQPSMGEEIGAESEVEGAFGDEAVVGEPSLIQEMFQRFREAVLDGNEAAAQAVEAELTELVNSGTGAGGDALQAELASAQDRFLRLVADFDNFRKRSDREKLALATNVRGDLIEELLPIIDNFERARDMIKAETEEAQKVDGSYQGIYKQFVDMMKKNNVEAIATVGGRFDPNVHEAIMQEESVDFHEGIVSMEFRKGFKLNDKVLRPAMVKVSAGPGPTPAPATGPDVHAGPAE